MPEMSKPNSMKLLTLAVLLLISVFSISLLSQEAGPRAEKPKIVIVSGAINGTIIVPKIDMWDRVNGPFAGGKVVLQIPSEDSVELYEVVENIWCRVRHLNSDSVGFVSKNFIPALNR